MRPGSLRAGEISPGGANEFAATTTRSPPSRTTGSGSAWKMAHGAKPRGEWRTRASPRPRRAEPARSAPGPSPRLFWERDRRGTSQGEGPAEPAPRIEPHPRADPAPTPRRPSRRDRPSAPLPRNPCRRHSRAFRPIPRTLRRALQRGPVSPPRARRRVRLGGGWGTCLLPRGGVIIAVRRILNDTLHASGRVWPGERACRRGGPRARMACGRFRCPFPPLPAPPTTRSTDPPLHDGTLAGRPARARRVAGHPLRVPRVGRPADTVDDLRAHAALDRLARLHQVDAELAERREGALGRALRRHRPGRRRQAAAQPADDAQARALQPAPHRLGPASPTPSPRCPAEEADDGARLRGAARRAGGAGGRRARGVRRARRRRCARASAGCCDDADFRKGLMISSRSLYGSVDRYGARPRAAAPSWAARTRRPSAGCCATTRAWP